MNNSTICMVCDKEIDVRDFEYIRTVILPEGKKPSESILHTLCSDEQGEGFNIFMIGKPLNPEMEEGFLAMYDESGIEKWAEDNASVNAAIAVGRRMLRSKLQVISGGKSEK